MGQLMIDFKDQYLFLFLGCQYMKLWKFLKTASNSILESIQFRLSFFLQMFFCIKSHLKSKIVFQWRSSFIEGPLPSKDVYLQRSFTAKWCLPSRIVLHWRLSSINVVFYQQLSSIKGCVPSKVTFDQRLISVKGHLPKMVIFHQWSSSIEGCLQ